MGGAEEAAVVDSASGAQHQQGKCEDKDGASQTMTVTSVAPTAVPSHLVAPVVHSNTDSMHFGPLMPALFYHKPREIVPFRLVNPTKIRQLPAMGAPLARRANGSGDSRSVLSLTGSHVETRCVRYVGRDHQNMMKWDVYRAGIGVPRNQKRNKGEKARTQIINHVTIQNLWRC